MPNGPAIPARIRVAIRLGTGCHPIADHLTLAHLEQPSVAAPNGVESAERRNAHAFVPACSFHRAERTTASSETGPVLSTPVHDIRVSPIGCHRECLAFPGRCPVDRAASPRRHKGPFPEEFREEFRHGDAPAPSTVVHGGPWGAGASPCPLSVGCPTRRTSDCARSRRRCRPDRCRSGGRTPGRTPPCRPHGSHPPRRWSPRSGPAGRG